MQPIDFGSWMLGTGSLVKSQIPLRAQIQWARILDKDSDISLFRNGVTLDPQTVRIEWDDLSSDASDMSGNSTSRRAYIFGVRGHPEIDDLDIQIWDTFTMNDVEYTVVSVNREMHGVVQAEAEVVG